MKSPELTQERSGPASRDRARPSRGGAARYVWVGVVLLAAASGFVWWSAARSAMDDDATTLTPAKIDGARAFGYLKKICDLGPRPAGSEANDQQRKLVSDHFKSLGGKVTEQPFNARDPISGKALVMTNLIGSWFPERTQRVVICAHYDTRPYPDREPDPRLRNAPFLGANDCASGVALLMEIAHHLKDSPTQWGVDLVLFDGEELVYDREGEYFLGSKEFGRRYKAAIRDNPKGPRYAAGILFDMVGGKGMRLPKEPYSVRYAGGLVRDVWDVARRLKARSFLDEMGRTEVLDDHLALIDAGIPTIDIIDFEYEHWHTASDIPENCAPESLAEVGRVVTAWLSKPIPKSLNRRR